MLHPGLVRGLPLRRRALDDLQAAHKVDHLLRHHPCMGPHAQDAGGSGSITTCSPGGVPARMLHKFCLKFQLPAACTSDCIERAFAGHLSGETARQPTVLLWRRCSNRLLLVTALQKCSSDPLSALRAAPSRRAREVGRWIICAADNLFRLHGHTLSPPLHKTSIHTCIKAS